MSTEPPHFNNVTLNSHEIPQFVMLTYDDAVTVANYPTYSQLFHRRNKHNACPIGATFFVAHENTNYRLVHELHRRGNEIASHSVTYEMKSLLFKIN
jgi:peptidoglycan/xylan/chitin deacetylase (PgdA/CDA1 family)